MLVRSATRTLRSLACFVSVQLEPMECLRRASTMPITSKSMTDGEGLARCGQVVASAWSKKLVDHNDAYRQ